MNIVNKQVRHLKFSSQVSSKVTQYSRLKSRQREIQRAGEQTQRSGDFALVNYRFKGAGRKYGEFWMGLSIHGTRGRERKTRGDARR